jgi:hypothetical protein
MAEWQTRTLEVCVPKGMEVRVLFGTLMTETHFVFAKWVFCCLALHK